MIQNLRTLGWDVNGQDYDGRTASHIVASEGHLPVIKFLVAMGADLSLKNSKGNDPIDDSIRENRKDVELYLR